MAFPPQEGRAARDLSLNLENGYSGQQTQWNQGYNGYSNESYNSESGDRYGSDYHSGWAAPPQRPGTAAGQMQPSSYQAVPSPSIGERQESYRYNQQGFNSNIPSAPGQYHDDQAMALPTRPSTAPQSSAWQQPSTKGDTFHEAPYSQQSPAGRAYDRSNDSYGPGDVSVTSAAASRGQNGLNLRPAPAKFQKSAMGSRPPPRHIDASGSNAATGWHQNSTPPPNGQNMYGAHLDGSNGYSRAQAHGQRRPPPGRTTPGPRGDAGVPRDARRGNAAPGPSNGRSGARSPYSAANGHGGTRAPRDGASNSREPSRPNPGGHEHPTPASRRRLPNGDDLHRQEHGRRGAERLGAIDPPRPATAAGIRTESAADRSPGQNQERSRRRLSDTLPSHPTPVRPGLMQGEGSLQQKTQTQGVTKGNANPESTFVSPSISAKTKEPSPAITYEELDRLRREITQRPADQNLRMQLAKRLVEAAHTLADNGGRADTRTRDKNREKFVGESYQIVKKLVAENHVDAQFFLADCLGSGSLGIPIDPKEAFHLYQQAAKAGHAQAAYRTAVCCEIGPEEGGGTRKDTLKAFQWYKRAAALGDQPSMYKVGMIQLKGLLGQEVNVGEAVTWLKRAVEFADEQNPHAMHELAGLYDSQSAHRLVGVDDGKALDLYTRAANFGFKRSQFKLGQAYEYGTLGCPIDARNSIIWYTRAAAQGEHQSELALSGWYLTGSEGILEHSDVEAYLWARKAALAEPPLAKAMFALGYYTEVGIGCPRSLEEAKKWYSRAAAHHFPKAQERLDELRRGGAKVQKNREQLSRKNQKQQEAECTIM